MAERRRFPYSSNPPTCKQEHAIDQALGEPVAALREASCLALLKGETFTKRQALESLVTSWRLGLFPRWEVIDLIARSAEEFLDAGSNGSLDAAFNCKRKQARPRNEGSEWLYLDIAHCIVADGLPQIEACRRVCSVRNLPISPESLAAGYRKAGPCRLEDLARRRVDGEGSEEIEHVKRAIRPAQATNGESE